MSIGASNLSGERVRLFEIAMAPQSTAVSEGKVLVYCLPPTTDNLAVDVPNGAYVLLGGRAFAGISASSGSVQLPQDNQVLVQKAGIAKCLLAAGEACTAGALGGYDPADGGLVRQIPLIGAGRFVPIGRFAQTKSSSASPQMVGVELLSTGNSSGWGLLGETLSASAPVSNTTSETLFSQSVLIPAGRIAVAGTKLRIRARVTVAGGVANDTLQIRCRLDSLTGTLLGSTPAVDVTNGAGDIGVLDLEVLFRGVGFAGVMHSVGIGGISPGQAVATGGNVQTTGTAVAASVDTTVDHSIVISAQWSAANMADVCSLDILSVEILG